MFLVVTIAATIEEPGVVQSTNTDGGRLITFEEEFDTEGDVLKSEKNITDPITFRGVKVKNVQGTAN